MGNIRSLLTGSPINRIKDQLHQVLLIGIILGSITISYSQDTLMVPEFSVQRGFYESTFDVVITSDTGDASIVYTLDGSDPTTSQNAFTESSPATVYIDPDDETGRFTSAAVILRAIALQQGFEPSGVGTHTYMFLNKINELSPDEQKPGSEWPERNMDNGNEQYMDYGLDPEVLNDPSYQDNIQEAFSSLPSISLVTDLENLFEPDSGIYVNATKHGKTWERPVSIEWLNYEGSCGFQIDAGLRIRGGWGRRNQNPKHSFRLFFREEYGYGKLEYPLFGDEGVNRFDKIDLRTSQNYSWAAEGSDRNTLVREVLSRDIQADMKQPFTRSRYYHLYINGVYWGIYQTQERAEASYAKAYFGGSKDDYDVIKVDVGENLNLYEIEATDGNLDAYERLWEMATDGFATDEDYFKVEGKNPDGSLNPDYEVLLDIDNLIDYMICTYYVADGDGPLNGNQKPNNFYAIFNRVNPQGFKFFRHDGEHALLNVNGDLTEPVTGGAQFEDFNPRWLQQRLAVHPEYRLRYADRVYKHFFDEGACTEAESISRLNYRKNQIDLAIIAQSARWGDSVSNSPRTRDDDWIDAINFIQNEFFDGRTEKVANQFRNKDWYPNFDPPEFDLESGVISSGTLLALTVSEGDIYYTIDGNDPRLPESVSGGGLISSSALEYINPLEINETIEIIARTLYNGEWSALNKIRLTIPTGFDNLKITEIHYHPPDSVNVNDTELEFIKFKNLGTSVIELGGLSFCDGIEYTFPDDTPINPDDNIVLSSNSIVFENHYGFEPFDEFLGQLSNSGETLCVQSLTGDTLINIKYEDRFPWPNSADGHGYSLVLENAWGDLNDASNWQASKISQDISCEYSITTAIETTEVSPSVFILDQNYPNPFNSITSIDFYIPKASHVILKILNLSGQEVKTISDGWLNEGHYTKSYDGTHLAPGVYFYQIQTNNNMQSKKMIHLK